MAADGKRHPRAGGLRAWLAAASILALAGPGMAQVSGRGQVSGQVQVRYVAPERFTDAENRWGSGQTLRVTLGEMTRIIEDLARRYLPPGDSLAVTVLDIDLAGFERPGLGTPNGLRVVTDATPPRIRLAYTLRRQGRVAASGEDSLTDINFLLSPSARFSTGALTYERALLRDWFARRFPEPRATGRG